MKPKERYNEPKTIIYPDMVARVYSPILDSQEREKRMKNLHRTTVDIMKRRDK